MLFLVAAAMSVSGRQANSPTKLAQKIIAYEKHHAFGIRDAEFLSFFTPSMRRAIKRDTSGRQIGVLNYDPLCQCQDNDGLRMVLIGVRVRGSAAKLRLQTGGAHDRTNMRLLALRIGREWKISDVSTAMTPSLAAALADY